MPPAKLLPANAERIAYDDDTDESVKRIGVFDSGIGGLSVLRQIHHRLPTIPTIYFADQANLPYGERPIEEIRGLARGAAEFLIRYGARVIVIACHAASAAGLHELRRMYPEIPFVGIEPAIKPAAEQTKTGVIGVLTTRATANSDLYRSVVERFAAHVRVITQPAPELVTMVEQGTQDTPEGEAILRGCVQPIIDAGADHLVLACTHFPFLGRSLARLTDMTLIDPGAAVARQVARVLPPILTPSAADPLYYTSGDVAAFRQQVARLLTQA
jgi:glutamate racemase